MAYASWKDSSWLIFRVATKSKRVDDQRLIADNAYQLTKYSVLPYRDVCEMLETNDFSKIPGWETETDILKSALEDFVVDVLAMREAAQDKENSELPF